MTAFMIFALFGGVMFIIEHIDDHENKKETKK